MARLEVLGSAADGTFDAARSDVDILVEFQRTDEIDAADQYFGLLKELDAGMGCWINLGCVGATYHPFLIKSVNQTRRLLYAP